MKPPTLRAQLRLMERLSDKSRMEETNLHKFTDWAARELRNALARLPKTGQKPRPICEALPDLRAAGAAHRAQIEQQELVELWSVADRELTRRTPTTPRQRVQPTPQPAAPAARPRRSAADRRSSHPGSAARAAPKSNPPEPSRAPPGAALALGYAVTIVAEK